jgi:hypothetical protein
LVVSILGQQMPAKHGELACHGDRCDLVTTSGSDTQEDERSGPGALEAVQAASASMARA